MTPDSVGASDDAAKIERFFQTYPQANIGIPTGAENGFWVLDADTVKGHGVDGIASLRALERQHGRLPKTLMAISPSGSLHYYFRCPKDGRIVRKSTSKIAPGIDIQGEGGMVLAPPSIKPGVGKYKFLNWGTPGADAPGWLLALVVRKKRILQPGKPMQPHGDAIMIKAALVVVNSDLYDVWFEIGCALHSELGEAGFDLFDRWFATSSKYDQQECMTGGGPQRRHEIRRCPIHDAECRQEQALSQAQRPGAGLWGDGGEP